MIRDRYSNNSLLPWGEMQMRVSYYLHKRAERAKEKALDKPAP